MFLPLSRCQLSLSTLHVQYDLCTRVVLGGKKKQEPVYPCPEKFKMSLNWDAGTWNEKHLKVTSVSLKGTLSLALKSFRWLKPPSVLHIQDDRCQSCYQALGVSIFSAKNHEFSSISLLPAHHYWNHSHKVLLGDGWPEFGNFRKC